jgi:hypothetical protein
MSMRIMRIIDFSIEDLFMGGKVAAGRYLAPGNYIDRITATIT